MEQTELTPDLSEAIHQYPYIRLDVQTKVSAQEENSKKNQENNQTHEKKFEISDFDKIIAHTIIKNYHIFLTKNNQTLEKNRQKETFLLEEGHFLHGLKHKILKSNEFHNIKLELQETSELERAFIFQKFLYSFQGEIKEFIKNYKNKANFQFKNIPDKKKDENNYINKENKILIDKNQLFFEANLTNKEIIIMKNVLHKIQPKSINDYWEMLHQFDDFVENKRGSNNF